MFGHKEEILFEWTCPKEASVLAAKAKFKRGKVMLPRVLGIIGIFWGAAYFALDYLLPPDFGIPFGRLFIVGFVSATLMLIFLYFGIPIMGMFSKTKYQITPEWLYILIVPSDSRAIRWKDIIGYIVGKYEELEGFSDVLIFYHKGRFQSSICLPQDERDDQIIRYIAERVPLLEKLPPGLEIMKLSMRQKVWLCVITGLYSLCSALYFAFYGSKWSPWLIYLVLFLGPGTIYLASIYGRRFLSNKSLKGYSLAFNLVSVVLIILLTFWLMLWQMKKEFGW